MERDWHRGTVEGIRILLDHTKNARAVRAVRRELIHFADSLALFLACGFDLSHGWKETLKASEVKDLLHLKPHLILDDAGSFSQHLTHLATQFPYPDFRQWFAILEQSYRTGSPVIPIVKAFTDSMRREQAREFEEHCRNLPTRTNILLLLFFLPPALLLVFAPLVLGFGRLLQ